MRWVKGNRRSSFQSNGRTPGILDRLNTTLGTSYTLDTPSLSSLLEEYTTNNYDFGMAYGCLRLNFVNGRRRTERSDEKHSSGAGSSIHGYHPDASGICTVIGWSLWWITDVDGKLRWPQPISHAWVDEKDRADIWTPINGYEWPVPIPKDSDLNLIRIEMLNLGLEYVWLDVLCLRQVGGPGEDMRAEEWKLDVPTIGLVYCGTETVVCYLSGLGRPFSLKEGDLDSDRCWFRRAWTLQEVGNEMVIAGDTSDRPLHAKPIDEDGKYETELLTRFHAEQLECTEDIRMWVLPALRNMQKRVSTNPVDKVAGLAFVMDSDWIPAYYESQSLEEAWTALVNSMDVWCRGRLFSLYPEPGNAGRKWRPSWDQVMMEPLPAYHTESAIFLYRNEEKDEDLCYPKCIKKGLVRGLAVVEGDDLRGELIVKDKGGIEHGFEVTVPHAYPIPDGTYTLIDSLDGYQCNVRHSWVVGQSLPGRKFEKVSVLNTSKKEHRRLEDLFIIKRHHYILI
ncbi:uncharacterized protein EV420DRAFT_1480264 [Desarmillaria tabescens]|uniref:Heterokaryon incompatibility domain-containing protein n=1 Tax=Armillaria tabescens TaxID=1929756 RepID=A0AA39KBI6_ARMTA|nr:uncharacterized protein EV420DRAFT_1480264 [Desarmillaria tabescens]KAK0458114.1 hypothetical protein EV420DRAFT_1480264 [Desarmillaria tabescens]